MKEKYVGILKCVKQVDTHRLWKGHYLWIRRAILFGLVELHQIPSSLRTPSRAAQLHSSQCRLDLPRVSAWTLGAGCFAIQRTGETHAWKACFFIIYLSEVSTAHWKINLPLSQSGHYHHDLSDAICIIVSLIAWPINTITCFHSESWNLLPPSWVLPSLLEAFTPLPSRTLDPQKPILDLQQTARCKDLHKIPIIPKRLLRAVFPFRIWNWRVQKLSITIPKDCVSNFRTKMQSAGYIHHVVSGNVTPQ